MADITSFDEFHRAFEKYRRDNRWMFRGQANSVWSAIPRAGRHPYVERDDLDYLASWLRRAAEFVPRVPDNIWECMALAQHHGLPTRLLDWTYNPLVAAFFACQEEPQSDAVVYCYMPERQITPETTEPRTLSRVAKYRPKVIAGRIARQSGLFSAHPDPKKELGKSIDEKDLLEIHVIKASYKRQMLFELNHYGVNRLVLMDDLDGLSAHMRWTIENRRYWSDHDEFIREIEADVR